MGRILKRILVGSGLALALFLLTVFLFGEQNTIALESPEFSKAKLATQQRVENPVEKNLTETISEKLVNQIIQDNPDGPKDGKIFLAQALAAETNGFTDDDFIEPIVEKNIQLLPDNSQEGARVYIQDLLEILKRNFQTTLAETADRSGLFEKLAEERTVALTNLYELKVTPDLAELHRDLLTLVGTQRNIFSTLAKYENDPLKALLAAQFEAAVKKNLENITQRLTDYVIAHKLNL